jgi:hypothetical protein
MLLMASLAVVIPAAGVWGWWVWPGVSERALPAVAGRDARTAAALCDRGVAGWCYGLAMMHLCGHDGLETSMDVAMALDARECVVDPDHCRYPDSMVNTWDRTDDEFRAFACRRTAHDTVMGMEQLPAVMYRAGPRGGTR